MYLVWLLVVYEYFYHLFSVFISLSHRPPSHSYKSICMDCLVSHLLYNTLATLYHLPFSPLSSPSLSLLFLPPFPASCHNTDFVPAVFLLGQPMESNIERASCPWLQRVFLDQWQISFMAISNPVKTKWRPTRKNPPGIENRLYFT